MGNIATNNLPALSTFVMEMTVLPMTIAMWLYSPHSLMSWAVAFTLVVTWDIAISVFFGVSSPLEGLIGLDHVEGAKVVGVLIILCLAFSLIGSFVSWLLDGEEVLPFAALFPMSRKHFFSRKGAASSDVSDSDARVKPTGLNAWGMVDLPKPFMHVAVTTVIFAIAVAVPHLIYAFFMTDVGSDNSIALACVLVIPIVGYILALVYWYYYPDPYVWGPHVRNMKVLGTRYANAGNKMLVKRDTKAANMRIYKTVVMLGAMHYIGVLVLALVRYIRSDVDWNWTFAAILAAIIVVVAVVCFFALYLFRGREEKGVKVYKNDKDATDAGDAEDESDMEDGSTMPTGDRANNANTNATTTPMTQQQFYASPTQQMTHRLASVLG